MARGGGSRADSGVRTVVFLLALARPARVVPVPDSDPFLVPVSHLGGGAPVAPDPDGQAVEVAPGGQGECPRRRIFPTAPRRLGDAVRQYLPDRAARLRNHRRITVSGFFDQAMMTMSGSRTRNAFE
jgi:hypothetical protein